MKILVINPGSTSTKIAVYENETPLLVRNISHTVEELSVYSQVNFGRIWYSRSWKPIRYLLTLMQSSDAEDW